MEEGSKVKSLVVLVCVGGYSSFKPRGWGLSLSSSISSGKSQGGMAGRTGKGRGCMNRMITSSDLEAGFEGGGQSTQT